jgi:hypothetical protein
MRCVAKRWVLWLGVGGVALTIGFALPHWSARQVPSTWDAFAAIREGMTQTEVEALLGGPAGNRSTQQPEFCIAMTEEEDHAFRSQLITKEWINDDALIWVGFDGDGRVARKFCTANRIGPPGWLASFRNWLGRW